VTSIGNDAFRDCSGLTSVSFGSDLETIGNNAFQNCTGLTSISLPNNLSTVGNSAFSGCTSLSSIEIPSSLTSIGSLAFQNNIMESIIIPISVVTIGANAFSGCHNVTIYTEFFDRPAGWVSTWNPQNRPVVWGYNAVLPNPSNLIATSGESRVVLMWDAPEQSPYTLSNYKIYRNGSLLTTTNNRPYIDTDMLVMGFEYTYQVTANYYLSPTIQHRESEPSNTISIRPYSTLAVPSSLVGVAGNTQVELSWIAPELTPLNPRFYRIIRNNTLIDTTSTLSYTDRQLTNMTEYTYFIRAVYFNVDFLESDPSNLVSIRPYDTLPSPSSLQGLGGDRSATLVWNAPPQSPLNFRYFNIYRNNAVIDTTSTTTFSDTGLINGIEYSYFVRAVYLNGELIESSPTNTINVTPNPVSENDLIIIAKTELLGNYPNPFNPETVIRFVVDDWFASSQAPRNDNGNPPPGPLQRGGDSVSMDIYNVRGHKVRSLVSGYFDSGEHSVVWDGTDDSGRSVASGIYFYRMKAGDYTATKKMILMK